MSKEMPKQAKFCFTWQNIAKTINNNVNLTSSPPHQTCMKMVHMVGKNNQIKLLWNTRKSLTNQNSKSDWARVDLNECRKMVGLVGKMIRSNYNLKNQGKFNKKKLKFRLDLYECMKMGDGWLGWKNYY